MIIVFGKTVFVVKNLQRRLEVLWSMRGRPAACPRLGAAQGRSCLCLGAVLWQRITGMGFMAEHFCWLRKGINPRSLPVCYDENNPCWQQTRRWV